MPIRTRGLAGATNKKAQNGGCKILTTINSLLIFFEKCASKKIVQYLPAERITLIKFHLKSKRKEDNLLGHKQEISSP